MIRIVLLAGSLLAGGCYLSHDVVLTEPPPDVVEPPPDIAEPPPDTPEPPDVCERPSSDFWVRNDCPFCNAIHLSAVLVCDGYVIEASGWNLRRSWVFDECTGALSDPVCMRLDTSSGCTECGSSPRTLNELLREEPMDSPRGDEFTPYAPIEELEPWEIPFAEERLSCDEVDEIRSIDCP